MSVVRCALTETRNAFGDMPSRVDQIGRLAGRMDEIRAANVAHHLELAVLAAREGAQVVCFGELFTGPYFALGEDPIWRALAEDARAGPTVTAVRAAAHEHGLVIVAPIYELDAPSGRRFNTAVVVDEHGEVLGGHRKVHVPRGSNELGAFHETFYYERSDGGFGCSAANVSRNRFFPVFETAAGRIGVATCYDRHFEGVVRTLAAQGAQIVFSPAATFGAKSRRLWELEFEVDAARQRVFIGGSNRRGVERPWDVEYFGRSHFVGPDGRVAPRASDPRLVIADLDLARLEGADSSGWDLGRDARPEVYD